MSSRSAAGRRLLRRIILGSHPRSRYTFRRTFAHDGSARERQVGEAQVDRHAPPLLLGQAVGVDAGERVDERRLAVVDVAGGADYERHGRAIVLISAAQALPAADLPR